MLLIPEMHNRSSKKNKTNKKKHVLGSNLFISYSTLLWLVTPMLNIVYLCVFR